MKKICLCFLLIPVILLAGPPRNYVGMTRDAALFNGKQGDEQ